jgi:hypothetical protein
LHALRLQGRGESVRQPQRSGWIAALVKGTGVG